MVFSVPWLLILSVTGPYVISCTMIYYENFSTKYLETKNLPQSACTSKKRFRGQYPPLAPVAHDKKT